MSFRDETETYAVLGLMGPESADIASQLNADALNHLSYFQHCSTNIQGIPVEAARLSYVGESGWEITCAASDANRLYTLFKEAGARPAGIFAQSSMRIEKQFLAYGHDLDADISPMEAGLDFAIDWNSDFIGKAALLEKRDRHPGNQMVSIILDDCDAAPLGNEPVYHNGEIIGKTTSAAFGYRVGKSVAIAQLHLPQPMDQLPVEIDIARQLFSGTISTKSVFDPKGLRMRSRTR